MTVRGKKAVRSKRTINVSKKGSTTLSVDLPTKPSELSNNLEDYSILVHGDKKIGKTALFAQEQMPLFLEFDPMQRAKSIYQVTIPTWEHCVAYIKKVESDARRGRLKFKTVVFDGVDVMYQQCFQWVCDQLGIKHPHEENDFGFSWGEVRKEFQMAIKYALSIEDVACRFICHSSWKEIRTRLGGKTDKLVPLLTGQAEECLVGDVDIWAAYTYDDGDRVLVIEGDESTGAGHRVDHRFKTVDGRSVQEIYMGTSAKEAYTNLRRAFNNEQTYATIDEMRKSKTKHVRHKKIVRTTKR